MPPLRNGVPVRQAKLATARRSRNGRQNISRTSTVAVSRPRPTIWARCWIIRSAWSGCVAVRHPIALGLDLPELFAEQTVPRHQPPQLGHRLGRQRHAGKVAQLVEPFDRLFQARPEPGDPMQTQQVLDAVLELQALADQTLALPSR